MPEQAQRRVSMDRSEQPNANMASTDHRADQDDGKSQHSTSRGTSDDLSSQARLSADPSWQQAINQDAQVEPRQRSLVVSLLPVFLIALQFGMDSTLWLPTAYAHIAKCTSSASQTSSYLSLAQLLPAAVQLFVSLLIGPLAAMVGSLKWPAVGLLLCSAAGNFIYSLAGPGAINNVWAIVGSRCLMGLASGSASLAMAYLTVSTTADKRLEAMSLFRTFGGVAMVLGPLLSIPLTRVRFQVGHSAFWVDGTNAPTFIAALTSLVIACFVALLLKDKSKPAHNAFAPLAGFFGSEHGLWKMPCLVLGLMLVSAYLSANVLFLLSDLLAHRWHIGITLASGIQAIVFALSLLASIGCGRLRQMALTWAQKRTAVAGIPDTVEKGSAPNLPVSSSESTAAAKMHAEVILTQVSQVISAISVLLILLSVAFKSGSVATAVVFGVACTVAMMGYNIQAASLPSLFSQSLPADVRASLVPWYAATVAAGKLAAPPITETIGNSNPHGWPASQSIPLALGLGAIVVLTLASKRLVAVCVSQSTK